MKNTSTTIITISILLLVSIVVIPANGIENYQKPLDLPNPSIIEMIQQVNESMVFYYHDNLMSFGSRYTGSENCALAAQYIYDEFTDMGLDTEFHEWKFARFKSQNVVATLPGSDPNSNAIIIMSAHYDCTPDSLGADDDGSGVAAIMAAANIMRSYSFNHTIRFIAFSGEEVGAYGSFMYARDAYNNGDNIYAVINLDMIGYANTTEGGNIIRFFCPPRGQWIGEFAKTVGETYYEHTQLNVETIPNYIGADHQAFIDYGYDAVFIAHHDGYPWGNSPEDTPDHINWTYQVKATKFSLALVAEFALKKIDVQVMLTHPYEGYAYFFNRPLFPLLFKNGWYKGTRGATIILGRPMAAAEVFTQEDIEYVVFCIDGNFMFWDNEPPFEWRIEGKHYPPIGKHTLSVYVYTTEGHDATDEMDITIFTPSSQYGKVGNIIEKIFLH